MLITPVIVAALSWLCWRYYGLLDLGKQLSPPALSCHLLSYLATGEILIPVEDLVLYRPGILLGEQERLLRVRPSFIMPLYHES